MMISCRAVPLRRRYCAIFFLFFFCFWASKQALKKAKNFCIVIVTSNLWTHAWSTKCR
jgi:hypothetical protein